MLSTLSRKHLPLLLSSLIVETDASDYALAAILSVVNEDNKVHPVAFHCGGVELQHT